MEQPGKAGVPAHVPPERVVDFDYHHVAGAEVDYHLAIKHLHELPDIFWTPRNGGHWVFTRGEDLVAGFKDYTRFSSASVVIPRPREQGFRGLPIESDPPEHAIYRALLQPAFSPRAISAREAEVRALTISLIEQFHARGECEFTSEFSQHLPITVFLNMVGLPHDDRLTLMQWTGEYLDPPREEMRHQAAGQLAGYVAQKIAERRAEPGEDLISTLIRSSIAGRPPRDDELIGMCVLLLFGGLDTVVSMLGFFANFLATHAQHRRQLVDNPELIPTAIEELLRRFGLANPGRVINGDFVYKGIEFKHGEQVQLMSGLHGLDERAFEDPLTVDFRRANAQQHSAFGQGAHRCIGSNLARTELKVFLQEWLARIPDFRIKPGESVRMSSGVNGGVVHLPLAWQV